MTLSGTILCAIIGLFIGFAHMGKKSQSCDCDKLEKILFNLKLMSKDTVSFDKETLADIKLLYIPHALAVKELCDKGRCNDVNLVDLLEKDFNNLKKHKK